MVTRNYSLRELRRRPGRTVMTLMGIAIGIGSMVAITASIDTTRNVYRDMYQRLSGSAALEIVSPGFGAFESDRVPDLSSVPGIEGEVPLVQGRAIVPGEGPPEVVECLGIDPAKDALARSLDIERGRNLQSEGEVLIGRQFADSRSLDLGDSLTVIASGGASRVEVVGILTMTGPTAFQGGTTIFVTLATARSLFTNERSLTAVQLVLSESAVTEEVRAQVAALLPEGLSVDVPASRATFSGGSLEGLEQGLGVMSMVSLVAGAFVVLNTFLMNLSERRRRFAILRAIGATRGQLAKMLLREAVLIGAVGTLLGLLCGWVLAHVVAWVTASVLGVDIPDLAWSGWVIAIGLGTGPILTVFATLVPIVRASKRDVLTDLFPGSQEQREVVGRAPVVVGVVLLVCALVLECVFLTVKLDSSTILMLIPLATVMLLIGCVLTVPLFIGPLARFVGRVIGPVVGPEGRLALRQIDRYRMRTSLTVGVLFMAITISIGLGNSILSNIDDLGDWFDSTIVFDVFVRGAMPDPGTMAAPAIPEEYQGELLAIPGAKYVEALNFTQARSEGQSFIALGRTVDPDIPLSLDLAESDETLAEVQRGLIDGGIALGTVLAHRLGKGTGDTFLLETPNGPKQLPIVGTFTSYTLGGMAAVIERTNAKRLLEFEGAHVFMVRVDPERRAETFAALSQFAADRQLMFQTNAELRGFIEQIIDGVIGMFWLLLVLVFVVSSLGTVNTLVMNVLEQTREVGVLRTIAMKRSQVRKMVVAQAVGIVGISIIPGIGVGVVVAYLMHLDMQPMTGYRIPFHLHIGFASVVVVGSGAITILASLLPARRASRMPIIEALQYE